MSQPASSSSQPALPLVVAITGASGAILGIRMLQILKELEVETHLVISVAGRTTIQAETDWTPEQVARLAEKVYDPADIGAAIASGSFPTRGMVIAPCSIKTLSAVANAYTADLVARTADVTLKEGRPLVLVVREAPLHRGHLRLLSLAAEAGATIFPPVPGFYTRPQSINEIVDQLVGRILLRLGISNHAYQAWQGRQGES